MARGVPSCVPYRGRGLLLVGDDLSVLADNLSLLEEFLHGRIAFGQFFDRQCSGFVIGQTQVVLRAQQRLFGLDEVCDGLINLINGLANFSLARR